MPLHIVIRQCAVA